MTKDIEQAADHWDSITQWHITHPPRLRWWESAHIQREINRLVCGKPLDGVGAGMMELMRQNIPDLPVKRAISIGCGPGVHEAIFVQSGIVEHFDLFDISPGQIASGIAYATSLGIQDRMNFQVGNAFEKASAAYDLVFWCGSLHHMPDVDEAIQRSAGILKPGGWFLMNEFVGPNRFQWSDLMLAGVNLGRRFLPRELFRNPYYKEGLLPRYVRRPTLEEMEYDPSEAVDSEQIIPSLKRHFPAAQIFNIGGNFYHIGLSDILANIPDDSAVLRWSLLYDRITSFIPHYAIAIAPRPAGGPAPADPR